MRRQPNGRPAIYLGADKWYHCYYTVGRKPDGRLDRRHIRAKTAAKVAEGIERLEAKLRAGYVPEIGQSPTLGSWLEHYLTAVVPRTVRRSTLQGYESALRHNVIPAVGHIRLDRPVAEIAEAVERFFVKYEKHVAPTTALQTFRILSGALKVATRRGKLPRNPCGLVSPPAGGAGRETDALTVDEVGRILTTARDAGSLARWWVALALGLRQGETLGLLWDYVDLDGRPPTLRVHWELIRLRWRHGCSEPCGRRGASCPQRHGGGLVFEPPKSRKGRRTLPLPAVIVEILREHRRSVLGSRLAAGPGWRQVVGPDGETGGLVFPGAQGRGADPHDDWEAWKQILVAAQVRQVERVHLRGRQAGQTYVTSTVRVHDSRHSAATTMFAAGMERRELMEWLGHSQISQSARYTHVPPELMAARAEQLNDVWERLYPDQRDRRPS